MNPLARRIAKAEAKIIKLINKEAHRLSGRGLWEIKNEEYETNNNANTGTTQVLRDLWHTKHK